VFEGVNFAGDFRNGWSGARALGNHWNWSAFPHGGESAMPDDKQQSGPQDRKRISLNEDYEVQYWTKALGVSKDKLTELVEQHGNSVEKIRHALGQWK
jgi:Protein of unknown function (DUF3606)